MSRLLRPQLLLTAALLTLLAPPLGFAQQPPPAPVRVITLEQGGLTEALRLPATVRARRNAQLSPEVNGLVAELLVDEGDRVKAGDTLLRLRQTQASLTLQAEQAALKRALAGSQLAKLKEARFGELLKSQAAAQDSYDIAKAELEQAEASASASGARVAQLRDRLQQHTLKAPFDGIVSAKQTEIGSWINSGEAALTLVETTALRIRFALPQQYRSQVTPGTPATVGFDAFPGQPIEASVSQLVAVANESARTLPGWIELSTSVLPLAPGMSAQVQLQLAGPDSALLVPRDALVMSPNGQESVWLVTTENGHSSVQPVVITRLRQAGNRVEIRAEGLTSGDQLVIYGNEPLRPGQAVQIVQP